MKKIAALLTMALIFSLCNTTVITARHHYSSNSHGHGSHSSCGKGYVDADGDGTCDNMKYTIKYHMNGGKNHKKNPSCYYNTTKTIKLKKPTKKGYTFRGWYADKQCRKKVTTIKRGSSGKKTLYAKWQKNNRHV